MTDGLVPVAEYATEDEARAAARDLLERGIAPDVRPAAVAEPSNGFAGGDAPHHLCVFERDRARALELLGIDAAEAPELVDPAQAQELDGAGDREPENAPVVHQLFGGRLEATTRQMVIFGVGYLLALVLIPLSFYLGTRWILEDDIDDPTPPSLTIPR